MNEEEAGASGGSVARTVHEIFLTSFLGEDETLDLDALGPAFARLAESMTDEDFEPGSVVYKAGDPARDYLFVASGEVVVKLPDGSILTLGERHVAGGADVTAGRPHPQTATATTRVHIVRLPREALFDLMEDYFLIAQSMLRNASLGTQELRRSLASQDRYVPLRAHDVLSGEVTETNLVDRILAFRASALFREAPMQAITKLAELSKPMTYASGDVVSGEGDGSTTIYLVMAGTLEAQHREVLHLVGRFSSSEVVLLDAVLAGAFAEYDVRAVTQVSLLTFDVDDLYDVMEEHLDVVRAILVGLTDEYERLLQHALQSSSDPLEGPEFKSLQRP